MWPMIESVAVTASVTALAEATVSGAAVGPAVMVTTSATDWTCTPTVPVSVWPRPSLATTVSVQARAAPVALTGAVQVGFCAALGAKAPAPRPPAQAAVQT